MPSATFLTKFSCRWVNGLCGIDRKNTTNDGRVGKKKERVGPVLIFWANPMQARRPTDAPRRHTKKKSRACRSEGATAVNVIVSFASEVITVLPCPSLAA